MKVGDIVEMVGEPVVSSSSRPIVGSIGVVVDEYTESDSTVYFPNVPKNIGWAALSGTIPDLKSCWVTQNKHLKVICTLEKGEYKSPIVRLSWMEVCKWVINKATGNVGCITNIDEAERSAFIVYPNVSGNNWWEKWENLSEGKDPSKL